MDELNPKLAALMQMSLSRRIKVVAADVKSGKDEYRAIPAHELARALGVPSPEQPDGNWSFIRYEERQSLEYWMENLDMDLHFLEELVSAKRYQAIEHEYMDGTCSNFNFLTRKERQYLEDAFAEFELERSASNGMNCLAHYTIKSGPRGRRLEFEAAVEDDGYCFNLLTPYDARDGKFVDLSNCVTDSW